jgi:two-component system CheB/CheR fusion protein
MIETAKPFDEVLITDELARRPARAADYEAENRALSTLAHAMASHPGDVLRRLVELVTELCGADSAGISILEPADDEGVLRWHATAGAFAPHLGTTMPRSASPCGAVLSQNTLLVLRDPERAFPELRRVEPHIYEGLLAPWHSQGTPIGTLWAVSHTPERHFDAEDARLLGSLAGFAAAAYKVNAALEETKAAQYELEQRVQERTNALSAANEALYGSEERYRLIVERADDYAILTTDPQGRITSWSRGAEAIFGWSSQEAAGQFTEITFTPEDNAAGQARKERAEAALQGFSPDVRWHQRKDGSRVFVDGVTRALKDGHGDLHGFLKLAQDVTQRRAGEEALRESELRLRIALGAARMGTWRWEIAEDRQVLDESLQRMLGVEGRGVMDLEGFLQLIHPDDRRKVRETFTASLTSGERFNVEFRVPHADGRITSLKDQGEVFYGSEGEPLFITGACVDITELKEAEQALTEADRRKDEFLATLAHELRNPLTPIANGLAIIRSASDGTPVLRRTIDVMDRQLNHLVRLVDDLLDVGRISAGKIELSLECVCLRDVIQQAVEATQPAVSQRGHRLELGQGFEGLHVNGDAQRLTQVFANLLSNAAKYTERGGRISVTCGSDGKFASVEVSDNGLGIPRDALPHVFDLFSQVRLHQKQAEGGLGIGLSIVRNLTRMHGGEVTASSRGLGMGSTFTVCLPLCDASDSSHELGAGAETAPSDADLRVLVVDDNEDAASTLAILLEAQGHQVEVAHNGPDAIKQAHAFLPDVVFLDLGMPGMSGFDAARELRKLKHAKPLLIAALSGWGQARDRDLTREAGFDAHLVKPPKIADVLALLAKAQAGGRS